MRQLVLRAAFAALLLVGSASFASVLRVEIGSSRSSGSINEAVYSAVSRQAGLIAQGSEGLRRLRGDRTEFSIPVTVVLTSRGVPLPSGRQVSRSGGPEAADIIPTFDTSGPRAFPTAYKDYLVSVFGAAKPAMNAVFGSPAVGGVVRILNYDADIPARQAVAGGIYVPNAPGGPEVHFPVYQNTASGAVNYVHCLLLAYMDAFQYPFDCYNEGLVRAATMSVSRVGGSIPGVTADQIEATLDSLYDVSATYQWSNHAGVGAPRFIAPNLLTDPLPVGGSTGGIYLLRYQMAGTAFGKVLAEYPGFAAEFNSRYYSAPGLYQDDLALEGLGQDVINFLGGSGSATVEGRSFSEWALRQSILDVRTNAGLKVVPIAFPIAATPGSTDFGVFAVVLNAFRTLVNGNEVLLSGTSFPIYWRPEFTRFFTSAQDDQIFLNGAYGAVVPNFPSDTFSSQAYRVAVDLPFQGKNVRLYLPAGAVSTGQSPTVKNCYGTLTGYKPEAGASHTVQVEWAGGSFQMGVQNFAFGGSVSNPTFEPAQPTTVRLFKVVNSVATELFNIKVNKGKGALGLDLRSPGSDTSFVFAREPRLKGVGFPLEPFRPNPADILGLPDDQTLVARWNPFVGKYDLYPDEGEFRQGLGYFVRGATQSGVLLKGSTSENTPMSVPLQPGWNLVTVPSSTSVLTLSVSVTTGTQAVTSWAEAAGTVVSDTFFGFTPDPVNPDAGTLTPSTIFEPGKAYFVKALKPEGAVLVFDNGASSRIGGSSGEGLLSGGMALGSNIGSGPVWRAQIMVTSNMGHACDFVIGRQWQAQEGNGIEDVTMPAGPGGFQAAVVNGGAFYRDLRHVNSRTSYFVTLTGLIPGQIYVLRSVNQIGSPRFQVVLGGRLHSLQAGSAVSFIADSGTKTLEIRPR